MRLWSLHPRLLDQKGLVACWREALLGRSVLLGRTRAYRSHPQLARFHQHPSPKAAINSYLEALWSEAASRGYSFDRTRFGRVLTKVKLPVTEGQLEYEFRHLQKKLRSRAPAAHAHNRKSGFHGLPKETHPLFHRVPGKVEDWEKLPSRKNRNSGNQGN